MVKHEVLRRRPTHCVKRQLHMQQLYDENIFNFFTKDINLVMPVRFRLTAIISGGSQSAKDSGLLCPSCQKTAQQYSED